MQPKSNNQNNTYHGYATQLYNAGVVKIDIVTTVWEGDLKQYVDENYKHLETTKERKSVARYLLKMMDIELPTKNPITSSNMNKNDFEKGTKEDLQHHISWLKEQLYSNGITPFNERNL